jgi:hypothetical protein
MSQGKKEKSFLGKFRHKYRLAIYRDETYEEVINFRLSKLNVLSLVGGLTILFLILVISIIAYTPVKEFIPGYPDENTVENIYLNELRLDSLEMEMKKRDRFFENMKIIISGGSPEDYIKNHDSTGNYRNISFTRSVEDSLLRQMIEQEGYNLSLHRSKKFSNSISLTHFFPPVRGMVTNTFNAQNSHYGIDIVSSADEVVKSVLDGTVIISSWTLETGWVIQIQHENNIISIYKHNAELLKKQGDLVKAGDPIAIVGNSGELSTGPHLHLELWHNMTPIDPLEFIVF